jgi:hypothetical protein
VPADYLINPATEPSWAYLKGAKREQRTSKSGHSYEYAEGGIAFPDPVSQPSRTILTGEGGSTPSRFKHVVEIEGESDPGRSRRRLTPIELERLHVGAPQAIIGVIQHEVALDEAALAVEEFQAAIDRSRQLGIVQPTTISVGPRKGTV